jgi:tripartite ATP-independent transporter DctM subunit
MQLASSIQPPRRMVDTVEKVLRRFEHALVATGVLLLVAIIVDVFAGVISRYVFNASLRWTEELGQWMFIWLIFIGIALGHRRKAHMTIGLYENLQSPGLRRLLQFLSHSIVSYTTLLVITSGWAITWLIGGSSPALQWPTWIKYIAVPLSSCICLLFLAFEGFSDRRDRFWSMAAVATGVLFYGLTQMFDIIRFENTSPSLVMSVAFVATIVLNVPIGFGLLFSAYIATLGFEMLPPPAVVQTMVNGAGHFLLLAIPLFLAAGALMNSGTLTTRIIDLAVALVGHLRGGLGHVAVLQSTIYGGISGSSGSDAAMHAKILVPEMTRRGYPLPFSCALSASSSILPNVIPPSIAMLLYAAITNVSVAKLFVAGIVPGLLLALCLMVTVHIIARRQGFGAPAARASLRAQAGAFVRATPVLVIVVFILGGIRFGVITPTEAGVVAAVWAFLLGKFVYRSYDWARLYELIAESALEAALIGFLVAVASPFSWVLIAEQTPQFLVEQVIGFVSDPWAILLMMIVLMLIAGTALELPAAMLILVPLFVPLIEHAGIDPVHFGVIVVACLMFGGLTPPVGVLVFIVASLAHLPAKQVFNACLPFLLALVVGLLIITYVPLLSIGLVKLTF